ncbi:hypothetical protein ScPMuIL_015501 [Solemya velum]
MTETGTEQSSENNVSTTSDMTHSQLLSPSSLVVVTNLCTGPMQISQESSVMAKKQDCAGCQKKITDRYMLKALEQYWHEDCLKCSCCDCRLGEVGSTLFTKANLLLCRRDYLRLFGTTGFCAACSKMIPAFEMVMRAKANVYHLECFACQQCNHRFCVGDRFIFVRTRSSVNMIMRRENCLLT